MGAGWVWYTHGSRLGMVHPMVSGEQEEYTLWYRRAGGVYPPGCRVVYTHQGAG